MIKQILTVETEFDLMVKYQVAIESNSIIVENSALDKFQYSLYSIQKPYPTYQEFINGNDFDEEVLLLESNFYEEVEELQEQRRKK